MKNLELVLRKNKYQATTELTIKDVHFGRGFTVIAGPCSVESQDQIRQTAAAVKAAGAQVLRGGVYKPRTSPYAFQGLGKEGLQYLQAAGDEFAMPIITEVVDTRDVEWIVECADILQVGARNMQNFSLLVEIGKTKKPVLLKRAMNATIAEWLNAAEYILKAGNPNVILCERGIRTHENYTRNTLDISAVAVAKQLTHLPVLVDPSHAGGRAELIEPLALSAIMAGADGLMIEVHPEPSQALSDAQQQLNLEQFAELMQKIEKTSDFYRSQLSQ